MHLSNYSSLSLKATMNFNKGHGLQIAAAWMQPLTKKLLSEIGWSSIVFAHLQAREIGITSHSLQRAQGF